MQSINHCSKFQVEIAGENSLDALRELEILFNTFDEIGGLEDCSNLQKLSLLDNGLKRISNLAPVSLTLTTLCICDQDISRMECLELPNLRNLYLHRNNIRQMSGLAGCPRLKRLWLFQNQLSNIEDLHCVPELQELWLQANKIVSTRGLEVSEQLQVLGLAGMLVYHLYKILVSSSEICCTVYLSGNPITDFNETKRIASLASLSELSLSDIHFGRCPIVDEKGYKDFILLHFQGLAVLDGVRVGPSHRTNALSNYKSAVKVFFLVTTFLK